MKIIVVSLPDAHKRRERISQQLNELGLEFEFLDAVRGTTAMYQEAEYQGSWRHKFWGTDLTPGEIGCYKSHRLACKRALDLNQPVLVLEDDLLIKPELKDFLIKLDNEINTLGFDILRISGLFPNKPYYRIKDGGFEFIRYLKPPLGAQGYIIKPVAADKFVKFTEKIKLPIDDAMDSDFLHKLTIYGYLPYLVEHDWDAGSDIGHRGKIKVSLLVKCNKQFLRSWWSFKRTLFNLKNYLSERYFLRRIIK